MMKLALRSVVLLDTAFTEVCVCICFKRHDITSAHFCLNVQAASAERIAIRQRAIDAKRKLKRKSFPPPTDCVEFASRKMRRLALANGSSIGSDLPSASSSRACSVASNVSSDSGLSYDRVSY